jgi:hypothetical protein
VAKATLQRFVEHAARLYEQERERPDGPSLLGVYVRRWTGWARSGLAGGLRGGLCGPPPPGKAETSKAQSQQT